MLNAADYITYKNMAADNAGVDRLPAFSTQENIDAVLNFVNKNSVQTEQTGGNISLMMLPLCTIIISVSVVEVKM